MRCTMAITVLVPMLARGSSLRAMDPSTSTGVLTVTLLPSATSFLQNAQIILMELTSTLAIALQPLNLFISTDKTISMLRSAKILLRMAKLLVANFLDLIQNIIRPTSISIEIWSFTVLEAKNSGAQMPTEVVARDHCWLSLQSKNPQQQHPGTSRRWRARKIHLARHKTPARSLRLRCSTTTARQSRFLYNRTRSCDKSSPRWKSA
mmetsp:Transcript_3599/g.10611  ORF Transcript_3599/g.10611 Transcript_3599/m.10611 type:complete len:207 (+) Transcript_3599:385-1005(+)